MGDFPPSSSVTRFIVAAPSRMIAFTHGDRARERDLVDVRIAHEFRADDFPRPVTTFKRPFGSLASCRASTNTRVCSALISLGLITTVQPAATAEASLRQMNSAFAFHAVISPATPTGSRVTVVLSQLRVHGISWSAFSAARNALTPDCTISLGELNDAAVFLHHGGRQIVEPRRSGLVQPAQNLRALLRFRRAVSRKRALGRGDCAPRVFLVAQRDAPIT